MKGYRPILQRIDKNDKDLFKNKPSTATNALTLHNLQGIINNSIRKNTLNTSNLVENICTAYKNTCQTERVQSNSHRSNLEDNSQDKNCYRRLKLSAKENNNQNNLKMYNQKHNNFYLQK